MHIHAQSLSFSPSLTYTETRQKFIEYSAKDAITTSNVFWALFGKLNKSEKDKNMDWIVNGQNLGKMSKFYNRYFRDFGELLTDMEKNGIMLDNQHLVEAEVRAKEERALMVKVRYCGVRCGVVYCIVLYCMVWYCMVLN